MAVDSYLYLPRSFVPFYEARMVGGADPVWADLGKPLADANVALLSSAGIYLEEHQEPFDVERERREPTWGDPSLRVIPPDASPEDIGVAHLHYNTDLVLADPDVALPLRSLGAMEADGLIGSSAREHYSVMGYQEHGARVWAEQTGPEIAARCRDAEIDVLVLAPS
jgi:D-proline reductase (dithiol) PrdB